MKFINIRELSTETSLLIGVAEQAGVAQRPVRGLAPEQIDAAQKWIRGHCNRIEATYMPIFSPEILCSDASPIYLPSIN